MRPLPLSISILTHAAILLVAAVLVGAVKRERPVPPLVVRIIQRKPPPKVRKPPKIRKRKKRKRIVKRRKRRRRRWKRRRRRRVRRRASPKKVKVAQPPKPRIPKVISVKAPARPSATGAVHQPPPAPAPPATRKPVKVAAKPGPAPGPPVAAPDVDRRYGIIRQRIARAAQQRYPRQARRTGVEGTVLIEFRLSRQGKVGGMKIVRSSGEEILDEVVPGILRAAQPLPWVPGAIRVPVSFKLLD